MKKILVILSSVLTCFAVYSMSYAADNLFAKKLSPKEQQAQLQLVDQLAYMSNMYYRSKDTAKRVAIEEVLKHRTEKWCLGNIQACVNSAVPFSEEQKQKIDEKIINSLVTELKEGSMPEVILSTLLENEVKHVKALMPNQKGQPKKQPRKQTLSGKAKAIFNKMFKKNK